jgi:hypothetical protein
MSGQDESRPSPSPLPLRPGDEAPPGTPGSGENLCRHCGGNGRMPDGSRCMVCDGTGRVTEELGGG